jgi:hypothetical protein
MDPSLIRVAISGKNVGGLHEIEDKLQNNKRNKRIITIKVV